MAKHGGNQGGRPKGTSGIEKEALRERLRAKVAEKFDPIIDAKIDNAIGIKHLMLRDPKTGKFERVTDAKAIDAALKAEGEAVWIYTKDPSYQDSADLLNRTIDKPAEQVDVSGRIDATLRWKGEK